MPRLQLAELTAFVAVAEHLSFTRAAVHLGVALPTVSQTIKALEERLEVRLFNRTTRSVALTEAGERLLAEIHPVLDGLDQALESVNLFRQKPIGTLRVAVSRTFATRVLAPLIKPFLAEYPDIRFELAIEDSTIDIVKDRFDAGIRVGHRVEKDMKIVRVIDDFRVLAVAAPDYLAQRSLPSAPADLHHHNCIRYRWGGAIQPWLFKRGRQQREIEPEGSLTLNDLEMILSAAIDGVGVAYLAEPIIKPFLSDGRLVRVLPEWDYWIPGAFLYHPSRRQTPMALAVFLQFIKGWRKTNQQPFAGHAHAPTQQT